MTTIKHTALRIKQLKQDNLWNDVPEYPREDWKREVANDDTNLGYWEWVNNQFEIDCNL
jgi:hypothetical protein